MFVLSWRQREIILLAHWLKQTPFKCWMRVVCQCCLCSLGICWLRFRPVVSGDKDKWKPSWVGFCVKFIRMLCWVSRGKHQMFCTRVQVAPRYLQMWIADGSFAKCSFGCDWHGWHWSNLKKVVLYEGIQSLWHNVLWSPSTQLFQFASKSSSVMKILFCNFHPWLFSNSIWLE